MNESASAVIDSRTYDSKRKTSDGVPLRFEGCIGCPDMGIACSGPNLLILTIPELRLWANRWREHFKLSVVKCADAWDMPEGTVSRFLSSSEPDFRYASIQGIVHGILRYGLSAEQQAQYTACPATTAQISEKVSGLEKQLLERTEECAQLTARKLERTNEFTERMAEQRSLFEADMAQKIDTIQFLKTLAEKRQRDLEKSEAVAQNYLDRIDRKNAQIEELNQQIRKLNADMLRMASDHAGESMRMVDRVIRLSEDHAADFRKMHFTFDED